MRVERPGSEAVIIRMLGPFTAVSAHGAPLTRPGRRSIALIACLAVDPDTIWTRDRLARLLWGGRRIEQGRTSLRQEIVRMRQALGRNPIVQDAGGGALRLRNDDFGIDVVEFRSYSASRVE